MDEMDNVTPISRGKRRQQKAKQGENSQKISKEEVYRAIGDAISNSPASLLPAFQHDVRAMERVPGVRDLVSVSTTGVVTVVPDSLLTHHILDYCQNTCADKPDFILSHRHAAECAKTWLGGTQAIPVPPMFKMLSEHGLCRHRIPFDCAAGPTPTWDTIFDRIESEDARKALKAWIGSLFFMQSYRQQYVWIYGGGGNGKGAVTRFLHSVFGKCSQFISSIPKEPNQFWTSQLVDKRLVVVPDCDNFHFPSSGLFKSITGDDPINVEPKRKTHFTTTLECKFIFSSNELPAVKSDEASRRRAIFIRMVGTGTWEADFEEKLYAEGAAFLAECQKTYLEMCPTHGPIKALNADLEDWVSTLEEPFEELAKAWLHFHPESHIAPSDMQTLLQRSFSRRGQQLEFLKWLEKSKGVRKKTIRIDNETTAKAYVGCHLLHIPWAVL